MLIQLIQTPEAISITKENQPIISFYQRFEFKHY